MGIYDEMFGHLNEVKLHIGYKIWNVYIEEPTNVSDNFIVFSLHSMQ